MRDEVFELYPFVDLAFGPGAIHALGEYVQAGGEIDRGHFGTFDRFAGHLPVQAGAPSPGLAADLPGLQLELQLLHRAVRARAGASRRAADLVDEATGLAADGVVELTLLGQNVNSWGATCRSPSGSGSASCCERWTPSTASSASGSRARIPRTCATT